jgi:hypothetical protein
MFEQVQNKELEPAICLSKVGKGASDQTQIKTNKAQSAPPQIPSPLHSPSCLVSGLRSIRAWNLRGRAPGLVGFGLCLVACPFPTALLVVKLGPFLAEHSIEF